MIIFNDTLGAYGGSHTLMLRMCNWLCKNHIRTGIFCNNKNNKEIVEELENLGVEIYVIDIQNSKLVGKLLKTIEDEVKIINFSWNFYLDMERAKRVCKLEFDNLVYCIHVGTFQKGSGFKSNFMKRYSIKRYKGIFERMNQNNALIMMDEVCYRISKEFLDAKIERDPPIFRIPMECKDISQDKIESIINDGFRNQIIMTASRAEIPYKGYLLGLIDDFERLKKRYPYVKLEIISAGEDIGLVEERIERLPNNVKKDIILHAWMEYELLKKQLEKSMIFIGMGTSILDAALKYKPAIPVKFYTVQNKAESVFAENPQNICAGEQCTSDAYPLIAKLLGLSEDQYKEASFASFCAAKENYNIESIMNRLIKITTNNNKCILSRKECIIHMMNNKLNYFRFKGNSHFDCRTIKKE